MWGSIPIAAAVGQLTIGQLYAVTFVAGVLDVCFLVAYRSYLPSLVERRQLTEANAKLAATDGVTRTAGPSLAGGLVQLANAPIALAVQAISMLGSALLIWRIRRPGSIPPRSEQPQLRGTTLVAIRDGLRFAWRHNVVRACTLSDASYLFGFAMSYAVQIVFFTRDLGIGPAVIGVIFTTGSVGGLLAALVARPIGRRLRPGWSLVAGSVLRASGIALVPMATLAGDLALALLIGARLVNASGWTLWEVHQETVQQQAVPDRLRGRVNASTLVVVQGADAIGALVGAGLAATVGVVPTLVGGGIVAVLGTGWLFTARRVRENRLVDGTEQC